MAPSIAGLQTLLPSVTSARVRRRLTRSAGKAASDSRAATSPLGSPGIVAERRWPSNQAGLSRDSDLPPDSSEPRQQLLKTASVAGDPKRLPIAATTVDSASSVASESSAVSYSTSSASSSPETTAVTSSVDAFRFLISAYETSSTDEEETAAVADLKMRASMKARQASTYLRSVLSAAALRDRTRPLDAAESPHKDDDRAQITPSRPDVDDGGGTGRGAEATPPDPPSSPVGGVKTRRPQNPAQGSAIKVRGRNDIYTG
jgi:hypothetical protein